MQLTGRQIAYRSGAERWTARIEKEELRADGRLHHFLTGIRAQDASGARQFSIFLYQIYRVLCTFTEFYVRAPCFALELALEACLGPLAYGHLLPHRQASRASLALGTTRAKMHVTG
eukprot:COSAG06_NODE_193_length_20595_cov_74.920765_4_plen_117_part_00